MVLNRVSSLKENESPLELMDIPIPEPHSGEIRLKVSACGVCHTELDEIEGRITDSRLPVVPGHQVVGKVEKLGEGTSRFKIGDRVGVAWIFAACGKCAYCLEGNENLCAEFKATGKDENGGYAEYLTVSEKYAHAIPDFFSDVEAAPLLCAGAIGFRSLKLANINDGDALGLTGFGASAHLVLKAVKHQYPGTRVFVFARNPRERKFAIHLGAYWSGDTTDTSPQKLDAIIDTTPVWKPVVEALRNLKKGGRLIINAIRKEEVDKAYLQKLSYQDHLWLEKELKTVANVTRSDVSGFLELAAKAKIRPEVQTYPLEQANQALLELKTQKIRGAKVLIM